MLLDDFEKGLTSKRIDEIFAQVSTSSITQVCMCIQHKAQATSLAPFPALAQYAAVHQAKTSNIAVRRLMHCGLHHGCVVLLLQVREGLVPLIAELRKSSTPPDDEWLKGDYDVERQAALCKQVCGHAMLPVADTRIHTLRQVAAIYRASNAIGLQASKSGVVCIAYIAAAGP